MTTIRVVIVAAVLVSMVAAAPARAAEDLAISSRSNDRSLFLTSTSGVAFSDCTIYVNDGYTASITTIPASGSAEIWLTELISKRALRFDPKMERLRRVHVICRKPTFADALFKID